MAEPPSLDELGLAPGEPVRWRRRAGANWSRGTVIRREVDGSVAVRDGEGAWRSMPVDNLEVQVVTRAGTRRWRPLSARVGRTPQLKLW